MDVYLMNTGTGLVPASQHDSEALGVIKLGGIIKAKISRPRNPGNHRRYFEFIRTAFDCQDQYTNIEQFRKILQIKAGHYEAVIDPNGKTMYWPKSISWADLEEPDFQELFSQVIDGYLELFGQGLDDDAVMQIIGFG